MDPQDPSVCSFDSPDPETTFAQAALLGRAIGARGLAIGLIGPLGAGKTVFVKGLASGLGVDASMVSSPTFVIAQQYFVPEGPEALHHLDLYRLASEAELEGIGFLDWLGPGQVLAVEWLDRFPDVLGEARLEIEIQPAATAASPVSSPSSSPPDGDTAARRLRVRAFGDEPRRVLQDWAERIARLEREAGGEDGGGRGASGLRGDLVVALLMGLVGLTGLLGSAGRACDRATADAAEAFACARTLPVEDEAFGSQADPTRDDGLGPLRVVCADEGSGTAGQEASEASLSGIALLLEGGRVDANQASPALLENLPGIGAGRAAAIVEERRRAPFASVRELERVSGIGPKLRAQLEPYLRVDPLRADPRPVDSAGPPG